MDSITANRIVRKIQFIINDATSDDCRCYDPCDLLQEIAEFIETENDESEYDEMEAHMDQPF